MIELPWDGRPVLLGRSSIACDHQLSSNRLISRVHVTAAFKEAISDSERDRVTVTCTGWNGIKIHRRGAVLEIKKGETFSSDQKDLDVILDVQDSRVCLKWPTKNDSGYTSVSSDDESASSPTRYSRSLRRHSTPTSPIRPHTRFVSPVSPSPGMRGIAIPSSPPSFLQPSSGPLVIYEDEPGGAEDSEVQQPPAAQSDVASNVPQQGDAKSSSQPKNSHDNGEEFSDPDEENDPIIHSFGPAGANLLPRMASVVTHARQQTPVDKDIRTHIQPLRPSASPPQTTNTTNSLDTRSHVINQLAFSRLASTPLSTIISHLPVDVDNLSSDSIREIMMQTRCIGEVTREGKDAAGKALESEFYYIPDEDEDELRREAVVKDLRKPGLRACRKQHKVGQPDSDLVSSTDLAISNTFGESRNEV